MRADTLIDLVLDRTGDGRKKSTVACLVSKQSIEHHRCTHDYGQKTTREEKQ
jgi:hypothetical protein